MRASAQQATMAAGDRPIGRGAEIRPLPRRRGVLRAILVTMRPRQWIKNGLVVAAPAAAGALGHAGVPLHVVLACAAFCLLSAGTYAINDVHDLVEDRRHPRKRHRPVAAGELTPRTAVALGVVLALAGLLLCVAIRPLLAVVGGGYVAVTLSYTLLWRKIQFADVLTIAAGFVLRAVAGGVAASVLLSRWFVLVVSAAAVFVAAAKRYAELRRSRTGGNARRSIQRGYNPRLLRVLLSGSAAVALISYCVWAVHASAGDDLLWRGVTIVPFAAAFGRYGNAVRAGAGEAPEEVLLSDRALQTAALAWLLMFAFALDMLG